VAIGAGVYSLIGVVVGAGATGGFQWWLTARTDRRDARAARRLVNAELTQIAFAVKAVAEHPEWGSSAEMQRRMTAHASWDAYAEVLARELSKTSGPRSLSHTRASRPSPISPQSRQRTKLRSTRTSPCLHGFGSIS
jgi:hypothetical protein